MLSLFLEIFMDKSIYMKKLFLISTFALFAYNSYAAEQIPPLPVAQCAAQVPYGMPSVPSDTSTISELAHHL